jgi:hypothetical protein
MIPGERPLANGATFHRQVGPPFEGRTSQRSSQ